MKMMVDDLLQLLTDPPKKGLFDSSAEESMNRLINYVNGVQKTDATSVKTTPVSSPKTIDDYNPQRNKYYGTNGAVKTDWSGKNDVRYNAKIDNQLKEDYDNQGLKQLGELALRVASDPVDILLSSLEYAKGNIGAGEYALSALPLISGSIFKLANFTDFKKQVNLLEDTLDKDLIAKRFYKDYLNKDYPMELFNGEKWTEVSEKGLVELPSKDLGIEHFYGNFPNQESSTISEKIRQYDNIYPRIPLLDIDLDFGKHGVGTIQHNNLYEALMEIKKSADKNNFAYDVYSSGGGLHLANVTDIPKDYNIDWGYKLDKYGEPINIHEHEIFFPNIQSDPGYVNRLDTKGYNIRTSNKLMQISDGSDEIKYAPSPSRYSNAYVGRIGTTNNIDYDAIELLEKTLEPKSEINFLNSILLSQNRNKSVFDLSKSTLLRNLMMFKDSQNLFSKFYINY